MGLVASHCSRGSLIESLVEQGLEVLKPNKPVPLSLAAVSTSGKKYRPY